MGMMTPLPWGGWGAPRVNMQNCPAVVGTPMQKPSAHNAFPLQRYSHPRPQRQQAGRRAWPTLICGPLESNQSIVRTSACSRSLCDLGCLLPPAEGGCVRPRTIQLRIPRSAGTTLRVVWNTPLVRCWLRSKHSPLKPLSCPCDTRSIQMPSLPSFVVGRPLFVPFRSICVWFKVAWTDDLTKSTPLPPHC